MKSLRRVRVMKDVFNGAKKKKKKTAKDLNILPKLRVCNQTEHVWKWGKAQSMVKFTGKRSSLSGSPLLNIEYMILGSTCLNVYNQIRPQGRALCLGVSIFSVKYFCSPRKKLHLVADWNGVLMSLLMHIRQVNKLFQYKLISSP